ncbi:MAG: hypothetical protein IJ453_02415 [Oscillospiraceae bacterium]|nr:hypothetical protein [Oscillospiraceae bacterium]
MVYEYIKNIQTPKVIDGVAVAGETWKVGVSVVPLIVALVCVIGFFACFAMPKRFTKESVQKALEKVKKQ